VVVQMKLPGRASVVRIGCLVTVAVLSACAYLVWCEMVRSQRHLTWHRMVDDRILALAERCPKGVSRDEWAFYVHWTWNLHGNHGTYLDFDPAERRAFLAKFVGKLQGEVDVKTIDWIWDQYVAHSKGGAHYSMLYRPTSEDRLRLFREGNLGRYDLNDWLERRRRP